MQVQTAEASCPAKCCTPCQGSPQQSRHRLPFCQQALINVHVFLGLSHEAVTCNCSRKKCTRRAGTTCCRTSRQHRAGGFDHTEVLALAHVLSATRSTTSLVSPLNSRDFRDAVKCLCAGTPPKNQKTRTLPSLHLPLCPPEGPFHTKHTLLSGTDTTSSANALAQGYGIPG